ncbi:hypothetical protein [Streptococcus cristatus]|uniref:hypothetical protein n=1 Tax=Streptococcus cristatus TaxID=45634 RepID=UPI002283EEF6|nr:hypothetical protein [Streptococcus cristatus]MCY7218038.1 hypothetical protein [Streptococcus cristatus]
MAKSRYMSRFKWLIVIVLLTIITVGGIYMFTLNKKSEEERRNREYEVSLVKALKNSYTGIEEIKISHPNYTSPPGDWSCKVNIVFKDGEKISYGISHYLDEEKNYNGRMTYGQRDFLNKRKGITISRVVITYSNQEKGEQ